MKSSVAYSILLLMLCKIHNGLLFLRKSRAQTALHGLFNGPQVTVKNLDNGKSISVAAGSPLSVACKKTDMILVYTCKQGSCGSCAAIIDGKQVNACQTRVPEKKEISIKKGIPKLQAAKKK